MSKILAIEFNDKNIKIIEASKNGSSLLVFKHVLIDISADLIEDGMLKNINIIKNIIEETLLLYSISTKKAVFLINSNSIFIRKVELPYVKSSKETRSMINFKMQEILPTYFYQFKLMYKTAEIYNSDGVKKAKYIVNGMPLKMYDQYFDLSKRLKLNLISMDSSSNYLEEIIDNFTINNKSVVSKSAAFIKFDKNEAALSIINKGITEFARMAKQKTEVNSIINNNEYEDNILLDSLDEIIKYLKYYTSMNKENIVEKIYLYGDISSDEIKKKMKLDTNTDVETIDVMSGIYVNDKVIEKSNLNIYLNLLAAICSDNKHINFLTDNRLYYKYKFNIGVAVMSVCLMLIFAFTFVALSFFLRNETLNKEIAAKTFFVKNEDNVALNNEIEFIKNKTEYLGDYFIRATEIKERSSEDNIISSDMFEEIKKSATSDTKINSFSVDVNNIELMCVSESFNSVSVFVGNIRNIDFVDNVQMSTVKIDKTEDFTSYSYEIICNLKGDDNEEQ